MKFQTSESRSTPRSREPYRSCCLVASLAVFAGCASSAPSTTRRATPLPANAPVAVASSRADLPQPALVLGTLRAKTQSPDDRDAVVESFIVKARSQGCNGIAEIASEEAEIRTPKLVKVTAADGREVVQKQMVATGREYKWSAVCVRSTARPKPPVTAERAKDATPKSLAESKPAPVAPQKAAANTPAAAPPPLPKKDYAPPTPEPAPEPVVAVKPAAKPAPPPQPMATPTVNKPAAAPAVRPRPPAQPPANKRNSDDEENEAPDPTPI